MNHKVYLAGPMTGLPCYNFPAFIDATRLLRAHAFDVVSPVELDWTVYDYGERPECPDEAALNTAGFDMDATMRRDIEAILGVDSVVLLPGWQKSSGVRKELTVARFIGLPIYEYIADERGFRLHPAHIEDETLDDLPDKNNAPGTWLGVEQAPAHRPSFGDRDRPARHDPEFFEKGTNPKDLIGVKKPPLRLVPAAALIYMSRVMGLGADKYGPYNWRENKVRRSIYIEAAMRHLLQALDGEDVDPESGMPHEAHAGACMAILLDALATGNLVDDRPTPGAAAPLILELTEA